MSKKNDIIDQPLPVVPAEQWPTNRLLVKNQYNKHFFPDYHERNSQPSETVPNQTLSLKTLLDRYGRGLPLTGNAQEPQYYGDEEMPDLNRMDISEIHDLKKQTSEYIRQMRENEQTAAAAKSKADQEKHINDLVEKGIKERQAKEKTIS